jgi:hypothetical protein
MHFLAGGGRARVETPPIFAPNESLGCHGKMREGNVSHGYVREKIKLKEAKYKTKCKTEQQRKQECLMQRRRI